MFHADISKWYSPVARADDDYAAENIDGPLHRRIVDAAKSEIARRMNVNPTTVYAWLREAA